VHVAPSSVRSAVTTPGLEGKLDKGVIQVDDWTLVLFFDDGEASRHFLNTWSQGLERVSEKMKFHTKAGGQSMVKFVQVNCDQTPTLCATGPQLLPAVVMHAKDGVQTSTAFAILPDDIEEVITYVTQSLLNMNRKPGLELQWPYTLDGSFKLPNVPGQVSLVSNPRPATLNWQAASLSHEVNHFFFEAAGLGSGAPASQTLRALSKEKRLLVNPLAGDKMDLSLKEYRHWYTKLVPSVINNDFTKPQYEQSVSTFMQQAKPKLPRAAFRLNYDISRVGFKVSSVGSVTKNTWYDLTCKLAGLTTGGYFVTQILTSLFLAVNPA